MKRYWASISLAVLMLYLTGCSDSPSTSSTAGGEVSDLPENTVKVTRQDFGDKWPFTVNEGELGCKQTDIGQALLFKTGGVSYAINGTALTKRMGVDIHEGNVWAADPKDGSLKKDISPIIDKAREACR
jgi:hypothetical protein